MNSCADDLPDQHNPDRDNILYGFPRCACFLLYAIPDCADFFLYLREFFANRFYDISDGLTDLGKRTLHGIPQGIDRISECL